VRTYRTTPHAGKETHPPGGVVREGNSLSRRPSESSGNGTVDCGWWWWHITSSSPWTPAKTFFLFSKSHGSLSALRHQRMMMSQRAGDLTRNPLRLSERSTIQQVPKLQKLMYTFTGRL
jgi:hypothetical protein